MNKTLIIVILDESGSMNSKILDIIDGYNTFINNQKSIKNDKAIFYLITFNTDVKVLQEAVDLQNVTALTIKDYNPSGGTALYDAISKGVRLAEKTKTSDERVIFVIITDGEENSSIRTSKRDVKKLISKHEEEGDWTFLYIGENPEKWVEDSGMNKNNTIQFDHKNSKTNTVVADCALSGFRSSSSRNSKNLLNTN